MGTHSIIDEVEAIFGGLTVTGGGLTNAFPWCEWEESKGDTTAAEGNHVIAQVDDIDTKNSDVGAGAQRVTERVRLIFRCTLDSPTIGWAAWKAAFVTAFFAALRPGEKGFSGSYYVNPVGISFEDIEDLDAGRAGVVIGVQVNATLNAFRHDVYG